MPYGLDFLIEDARNALAYRILEGCQPTPDNWSKLDDSDELREQRGNQLFRDGQYELAFETYVRAFKLIPYAKRCELKKTDGNQIQASYFEKCHDSAAKCLSNAAACVLQDAAAKEKYFDFYGIACKLCESALEIDPSNFKAKYRLGLAMFSGENFHKALLVFEDLQNVAGQNNENKIASYISVCQSKIRLIRSTQKARYETIFENHEKILAMLQFGQFRDACRLQCKNLLNVNHLLLTKFELDESVEEQLGSLAQFYQAGAMALIAKTMNKDDLEKIFDKECDEFLSQDFRAEKFLAMMLLACRFLNLEMYGMAELIYKKIEPSVDKPAMCPAGGRLVYKFVGSYASAMAARKQAGSDTQTEKSAEKRRNKSRNRR